MRKKTISFIFAYRKRWGLSQPQLAKLVSLSSASAISRIERSKRNLTAATLIALSIVFDLPLPDLLASFYDEIEEAVATAAKELLDEFEGRADKNSALARALLEDIVDRVISRHQSPKDI